MNNQGKAYFFFHAVCIVLSLSLVGRCIYLFAMDEDTSQVEYKQFNEMPGSLYPSISFCFKSPLLGTNSKVWKYLGVCRNYLCNDT